MGASHHQQRRRIRVDQVGIYEDKNYSIPVTYLDWGTLEPSTAQNITLSIRNEGNHAATIYLIAENWNPPDADNYLDLGWNYDGTALNPMESVEVTLIPSVSRETQNISDFSFDVIIGTTA